MEAFLDRLEQIEEDLSARSFLYDDPRAFRDAVRECIARIRVEVEAQTVEAAGPIWAVQ